MPVQEDHIASTDTLLKSVSRTFYLTLKVLPKSMREPLSLAYLLARATDTIADTAKVEAETRSELLEALSHLIENPNQSDAIGDFSNQLSSQFSPLQENPNEADLLVRFEEVLNWLSESDPFQQSSIQTLLTEIISGQNADLKKFPSTDLIQALPDANALNQYTYSVAGCVGEFWTRLGYHHFGKRYSKYPEDELLESGIRLGKGLQLINILRDLPEDLANGRCYLPADELSEYEISFPIKIPNDEDLLTDLLTELLTMMQPVIKRWSDTCSQHLEKGSAYVMNVRHRRLRFAAAIPLNLAARTHALLKNATVSDLISRTKISKKEVKKIVKKSAIGMISKGYQCKLFRSLSA